MAYEKFVEKNFKPATLITIAQAAEIIEEYSSQGYALTLRQLYYQFVARDLIPNSKRSYDRLGYIINDARLAGYIDWEAIVDRTRNVQANAHWDSPVAILQGAHDQYRRDLWSNQPRRVEVWIEKEALIGVIEDTCRELDVPYFACRGYVSQSEQWCAGVRFRRHPTTVLHLGDHDPSGIDMTRDNADRLWMFSLGNDVEVQRLALNMDQIDEYAPPPNPAKMTDSRFEGYAQRYGRKSWELDALEPSVINELITENVEALRDPDLWREALDQQEEERALIAGAIERMRT